MTRVHLSRLASLVACILCLFAASSSAQPVPPGSGTPAKPPAAEPPSAKPPAPASGAPAASGAPPRAPAGSAAPDEPSAPDPHAGGVPPGHPRVSPSDGEMGFNPVPDRSTPSPLVPKHTIEVRVVDADGKALPGVPVKLGILRQSVAAGEEREHRTVTADASGIARFEKLPGHDTSYSYRVSVTRDGANFAAPPFNLDENNGQQVILHLYDVVRDLSATRLGMFGMLFVETRDDVFQFEVMFRVFNIGRTAWVPQDVSIGLPSGWKGFRAQDAMSDIRFESIDDRVVLKGTFTPGQHEVGFTFQVPNGQTERRSFDIRLPPRVGQMQVIAAAPQTMDLEVAGFEAARPMPARDGSRNLVAVKRMRPGESALERLTITLTGIPTRGPGAWIAVAIALTVVGAGLFFALKKRPQQVAKAPEELIEAQELILEELVRLTQAHARGEIGPKTFERARQGLLDAAARLNQQLDQVAS